jgi:two-component system, LytTR family, sensor kinase
VVTSFFQTPEPPDRGSENGAGSASSPLDHFPLTRRDLAFIVAFWAIYALLTIANHVFDPGPGAPGRNPIPLSAWIIVAVCESALWALITPLVVSLAGRAAPDRTSRIVQFILFALLGVVIALGVSVVGHLLRVPLFQRPPGANPSRWRGPPLWYGFLNALVIYLGVLAAGFARAYSLRFRARREQATQLQAQLAEAHLEALRRQLDPHFLFNTLNAVSSLVERDPRGVRRMISRLSELLRYSMEGARAAEIPLRRELDILDRYIEIMQVRFQGRLEVERTIDARTLEVMVPSMILQPLVENAIKHGVEKMADTGRITIASAFEGGGLVLRVCDNGPAAGRSTDGTSGGVGIRNTIARLQQLYGAAGRFTLARREDGMMVAELRIPVRDHAELRVQGTESPS